LKVVKDTVDLGEETSPKLALGLGSEEQEPFSIPDQVEVESPIPGEVVMDVNVFSLHYTFLVFFGVVGGVGAGSLLGSTSVVTPILGCNMAFLVAIWINCIYVWSLIGGCIWNGAIGSCILLDVVLRYGGFAMHVEKLTQP